MNDFNLVLYGPLLILILEFDSLYRSKHIHIISE
nr:MAG TPA: hypothetical protein [Caudoviricetes sp.]